MQLVVAKKMRDALAWRVYDACVCGVDAVGGRERGEEVKVYVKVVMGSGKDRVECEERSKVKIRLDCAG